MSEDEFESSWETHGLDVDTLRHVAEAAIPFIPSVVWSAPISNALGIYPAETTHARVREDGGIELEDLDKKWVVRVEQLREDPGFDRAYPSEEHSLTEKYNNAEPGSTDQLKHERAAFEYAKKRIAQYDELLAKISTQSGGDIKIPDNGRFYHEDPKNPVLLTVAEYIDGTPLMDPENPGQFSEVAKKVPNLWMKLQKAYRVMSEVIGELPHNAAFVPTDLINDWRQFMLKNPQEPGGEWDLYMVDLDPYLGVKSEEMKPLSMGFKKMNKQLEQLHPESLLRSIAKTA